MSQAWVVLVLLLSGTALFLVVGGAQADHGAPEDYPVGPDPWKVGMRWQWENGSTVQETRVDDHKELATRSGSYDVWLTRSRRAEAGGTDSMRMSAWVQGSHRRAYDQVHIYKSGAEPVTASTSYDPPTAFPMWETMKPGGTFAEKVRTHTEYMVGMQPAGSETHEWKWVAWADDHVYNLTTPDGTFEGYNVTVLKQEMESSESSRYRYFYSPEVRHFVATFDGENRVDFELIRHTLVPPPVARGGAIPNLPTVGENVTLDGSASHALTGEVDTITWELPDGTVLEGPRVTTTFDEPGRKTIHLTVTDTHNGSTRIPVTVRVIDRAPNFKIAGPRHAFVEEATPFRLIPPEDREIRRATWRASDVEPRQGADVDLVFPHAGRYNVSVTFVDSEGATGRVFHKIVVVGEDEVPGAGGTVGGSAEERIGELVPRILSPENNTRLTEGQALVVTRITGLEDPALILGNGLRVPLTPDGNIASAQVPLSGDTTEIRLVEGHRTVDRVVLHHDASQAGASNAEEVGNETPFPLVTFLLVVPLLRRRER